MSKLLNNRISKTAQLMMILIEGEFVEIKDDK
jgi:hypothetical protein